MVRPAPTSRSVSQRLTPGAAVTPSILGFNRAFIQWAGITAGITQSFYDFYSSAAVGYRGYIPSSDTGDAGWWLWAYTAQLGNGVTCVARPPSSAVRRRSLTLRRVLLATLVRRCHSPDTSNGYGGIQSPDIVGNLRVDQTWGSAQIMAAAHEVNAPYYAYGRVGYGVSSELGGPSGQWGFAVGAGLRLNSR